MRHSDHHSERACWAPLDPLDSGATRVTLEELHQEADGSATSGLPASRLGLAYLFRYEFAEARRMFARAVALEPERAPFRYNLGEALLRAGDISAADEQFRKAHDLAPQRPEPVLRLAAIREMNGQRGEDTVRLYLQATALGSQKPILDGSLLACLLQDTSVADALRAARSLLPAESATDAALASGVSRALLDLGRVEDVIRFCHDSPMLWPENDRLLALYAAHMHLQQLELAEEALARTTYTPNVILARFAHYRRRGDTAAASRLVRESLPMLVRLGRRFDGQPEWDGSSLSGRTVLLTALGPNMGSGFGDVIHWARFWPAPKQLGGRVVVLCTPQIKPLFDHLDVDGVFTPFEARPDFDFFFEPVLLPDVFNLGLEAAGALVPYAAPSARKSRIWSERFGSGARLRIGVAWRSSAVHNHYRNRNVPLHELQALFQLKDIEFYGLQPQSRDDDAGSELIDISADLPVLEDTAAAMSALDVVVTVDTVFAHLAGALGRPTLILLPYFACGRWLMDRSDCPHYPSARLFRQSRPGDWGGVIQTVLRELEKMRDTQDAAPAQREATEFRFRL